MIQARIESGRRRPCPDIRVALLVLSLALPACDTFFGMRGRATDCDTAAPLAGVGVDVQVDKGINNQMFSLPDEAATDARGDYQFEINSPAGTWATVTFHRDGFLSFTPAQFKGHQLSDPPFDLCLTPAP
jgi:hypothetical protein